MGIRYSAFRGFPGTSFSKNSLKPSSNTSKNSGVNPHLYWRIIGAGKMSVKVLKTNDTWYGMTYHEDVAAVKESFKKMLENGVYKADLFSDL